MAFTVLVIDDDRASADMLAEMLRILGHTPIVAYGPSDALPQLSLKRFDAIFLDLNMPTMDGVSILRMLRRDVKTAELPIVVVSAMSDDAHQQTATRAGANEFVAKPVLVEDIEAALQKIAPIIEARR